MQQYEKGSRLRKTAALALVFVLLMTFMPQEALGMVHGWRVGDTAYFKNGSPLRGSDGEPYYNYHSSGHRYAYCLSPINGGNTIRGYCLERNLMNPSNGNTKYYAKTWDTAERIESYSDDVQTAVRIAMLYGKQPHSDRKDLEKLLGPYSSAVKDCNMDDWWIATQTIIWEFTDGYRKSISGIPENLGQVNNGNVVLGTYNAGEGYDFHYNVLRGRPARHIYFAMLRAMKKHRVIPSFTGKNREKPKTIYMELILKEGEEPVWRSVNPAYLKTMTEEEREAARQNDDYYTLTDQNRCGQDLRAVRTKDGEDLELKAFQFIRKGDHGYILEYRAAVLDEGVFHGKKDIPEATTDELLVWQNSPSAAPLQTVALGGDDPVNFYFTMRMAGSGSGNPGEPGVPKLPSFTFDTEKRDLNPGWDQSAGTSDTGMGDAPLDSEITLYLDGQPEDRRILSVYGSTEGDPFVFAPWEDVSELTAEEIPVRDEAGNVLYTDYYWRGSRTVSTRETEVPAGRHPESHTGRTGERSHGTIVYYAHCRDDGPMDYEIRYEGPDGGEAVLTDEAEIDLENPQQMRDEKGAFAYVNDNYRGDLQIVKTKDDLDPFTNETNTEGGIKSYSTDSRWTLRLASGGWENCPYVRVIDEGISDNGYGRFTHKYRVSRDSSGTPADSQNPLTVSEDGQIYVYDLPYGTYVAEEIKADDSGYVLESFRVTVSKDGQKISKDINNQAKRNRIKIVKTNAETGKTVRWDAERTAFQIRYMGNPSLSDPTKAPGYGTWLPNGGSYTDDDQNYTFYANANGEIELPYDLEYGIYEIQELVVPKGYFTGQYDSTGKGTAADMGKVHIVNHKGETVKPPKSFLEAVQVRDGEGNRVDAFSGNSDMTYNTYTFSVLEQDSHQDGSAYTTYYAVLEMPNLPAKGKIEIIKDGQTLAGWNKGKDGIFSAVFGKGRLKDAVYEIYAAEDILQSDGVIPVKPYLTADDSAVSLVRTSRDHADLADAREMWEKRFENGAAITKVSDKGLLKDFGKANGTVVDYQVTADGGAVYRDSFTVRDEEAGMTYRYQAAYKLNYTAGGFNYTDIHLWKESTADDYVAAIDVTEPVLMTGSTQAGISTMNYAGGNLVRVNRLAEEADLPEDAVTGIHRAYNRDDIAARPVKRNGLQETNPGPETEQGGFPPIVRPEGWQDAEPTEENQAAAEFYLVTNGQGAYQILVEDGLIKRWVPCDEEGNYYKSYSQEYHFTTAQHYHCSDGFSLEWDDVISLKTMADHDMGKAVTEILQREGASPEITESPSYSHALSEGTMIFTGMPDDKSFVYFKTHDGIRTEMYLSGGLTHTKLTVPQNSLFKFDRVFPTVSFNGEEIPWNDSLNPEQSFYEKIFDDSNYLKARRHKPDPEKTEAYYTIEIVSDSSSPDSGFKIIYPDTTAAVSALTDAGEGAVLRFSSIDDTMVYPMGSPAGILRTGPDGTCESAALPLGEYWIREISSAAGHVSDGQWQKVKLEYKDQYTPLLWDTARFENEAVSVRIDLGKLFETDYRSGQYLPGSGAVFGIYTAENMKAGGEGKAEKKELPADTLVGRMTVADGQAHAAIKLPLGKYYIKEISAPQGYKISQTKYYFDAVDQLTADQMTFRYRDIGVSGHLTQNGSKGVVIDFDTLYRFEAAKVVIDGKIFSMDETKEEENIRVTVLDGRTNTRVHLADGRSAVILWENGASMTVKAEGQTYTAKVSGPAPSELSAGSEGGENFTVMPSGTGTLISYVPKVTRTNWLTEAVFRYDVPKEDAEGEEPEGEEAKSTVLQLTSPEGTSQIQARVDSERKTASLSCPKGEVTSILLGETAVSNPNEPLTLVRKTGEEHGTGRAVIHFADGVTFTAEFDEEGNFLMSAAGAKDGNMTTESLLTADGRSDLPEDLTVKHTTAKTYARNNTEAEVLNITVHRVKNDRLPEEPEEPVVPETPEEPKPPEEPEEPEEPELPEEPERIRGSLKLIKTDGNDGRVLAGAVFGLYDENFKLLQSGVTDRNGVWSCRDLPEGRYYYRELEAPKGYVTDGAFRSFHVTETETVEIAAENLPELTKGGKEDQDIPKTGDSSDFMLYLAILIFAVSGIIVSCRKFK